MRSSTQVSKFPIFDRPPLTISTSLEGQWQFSGLEFEIIYKWEVPKIADAIRIICMAVAKAHLKSSRKPSMFTSLHRWFPTRTHCCRSEITEGAVKSLELQLFPRKDGLKWYVFAACHVGKKISKKLCSSTLLQGLSLVLFACGGGHPHASSLCVDERNHGCRWDFYCISRRCCRFVHQLCFSWCKKGSTVHSGPSWLSSRQVGRSCKIEVLPNVISYNSVCTSCERSGKWWMSLQILRTMRTKRVAASLLTYNSALAACEQAFQWEKTLGQRNGDASKHQQTPRAIHNFSKNLFPYGFPTGARSSKRGNCHFPRQKLVFLLTTSGCTWAMKTHQNELVVWVTNCWWFKHQAKRFSLVQYLIPLFTMGFKIILNK